MIVSKNATCGVEIRGQHAYVPAVVDTERSTRMQIASARFGTIEINDVDVIRFPAGLVGLAAFSRFVLLQSESNEQIYWLQSIDEPMFSIPLINADLFTDYSIKVQPEDLAALAAADISDVVALLVVNRVDGQFTANMRGPILFNPTTRVARQIILEQEVPIRHAFPLELTALT